MHILGGVLLVVVVIGAFLFIGTTDSFRDLTGALGIPFGRNATSTVEDNNSQYYQQVEIHFVSLGSGVDQPMTLSLRGSNSSQNEGIVLTGWTLKTDVSAYTIPPVTNLYSPSVAGVPPEDIYLRADGTVNFYSGENPQGNDQEIRSGLGEWRVWLGEDFLAAPHGMVTLEDTEGKVVDEYEY